MATEIECSADRPCIVEEDDLIEALKKSSPESPWTVRISKVPQVLRRHRPEAYEPYVISIGPIHRDCKHVQPMENVKQWYLKNLLSRMDIRLEEFKKGFNEFLLRKHEGKDIIHFEKRALDFYEPIHLNRKDIAFMNIMILDGCFVIQLVRKILHVKARDDGDPILNTGPMFQYVCHDLLLLENQLPFFVLKSLYDFILEKLPDDDHVPKFSEALLRAFSELESLDQYLKPYRLAGGHKDNDDKLLHILHLIRTSIVFKPNKEESGSGIPPATAPSEGGDSADNKKESGLGIPPATALSEAGVKFKKNHSADNKKESGLGIPPATALSEAGVKFKKNHSADNLLDIKFKDRVLTIPELTIGELTEPLFRNLIAFEQCYDGHPHEVTSYAVLMDKLISSERDIELLSNEKIISNWLSVEDCSKCFSNLHRDTTVIDFQHDKLFREVNKYYQDKWNTYLEQFRRNYCSSPWKFIAFAVGILLLVVNLMQFLISLQSSTLFTGISVNELSADI